MELITFVLNTGAAVLMGMAIGLERQFRQHTAGLRTNALVSLGAALFVSLSLRFPDDSSPTRMASYVVSGIGFLGGGVILREGFNVRGMNTAATLWCSAAVGTLAGMGFVVQAAVGMVAVLVVHLALRPLVRRIEARVKTDLVEVETLYRLRIVCESHQTNLVRTILIRHVNSEPHMTIQGISTQETDQAQQSVVVAEIFASERKDKYLNELVSRISIEPSVSAVSWGKTQ